MWKVLDCFTYFEKLINEFLWVTVAGVQASLHVVFLLTNSTLAVWKGLFCCIIESLSQDFFFVEVLTRYKSLMKKPPFEPTKTFNLLEDPPTNDPEACYVAWLF